MRWERFAGDTATFAARLSFHRDPDDGEAATREMAESWGAFQLWVRGRNLCAHIDEGEELRSCHWYLLPLLEWLSENWDPLFHEERPPVGKSRVKTASEVSGIASASANAMGTDDDQIGQFEQQYDWKERHTLRAARQGGIYPDVRFRRFRDQIEVSWATNPLPGAEDVEFMSAHGVEYLRPMAIAQPLYEILTSASTRLHEQMPGSERFSALVESVGRLRQPQRTEERAAWLAGLGNAREDFLTRWRDLRKRASRSGQSHAVEAVFGRKGSSELVLDGCLAPLLFGSTSPTISEDDAASLADLLLESYEKSPDDGLSDLVFDEPIDVTQPPWQQGYDLAEELLDEAGRDLGSLSTNLSAWLADWRVRVEVLSLEDSELRAVAFVSAHHAPHILLNQNHWSARLPGARRFTLAHELCHLLHDRSVGASLAIASGPWAPLAIEQRANAFAAWLLMPPDRLKPAIARAPSAINTRAGIRAVAGELDVSQSALVRHLFNLGEITEEDQDELLADTGVSMRD